MLKRASIVFVIGLFFATPGIAQQTAAYTSDLAEYQKAYKLYKQKQYSPAQQIFEQVKKRTDKPHLKAEAAYRSALTALYLKQPDAEKQLKNIVVEYPELSNKSEVYAKLAGYYFEQGDYKKANKWYADVNSEGLTGREKKEYNFNRGYAYFKNEDKAKAKTHFNRVKDDEEYGSQAKYYLGYLAYEGDDYKKAEELFEDVDEKDRAGKKVSYFESNINFQRGNFEKAIELGKEQLPKSNRKEQSELNKIIGESYFNLEQYEEAIPYLEKYQGDRGKWNNTDYYQLGYAYYKNEQYDKAISQFNKIINGNDSVAQNAYYHLGESYIYLDKKTQALNAFKSASEMSFDEKIQEDAALNYAKLSYDIGNNYQSTPEILAKFLEEYPNSPEHAKIQELLVDSYVTSKDYKKAMQLLEESNSFDDQNVYQKVAFYRGLEIYGEGDYKEAKTVFNKSLDRSKDPVYTARATYWIAESDYNLEDYKEALIGYKDFKGMSGAKKTAEIKDIDYNIGYAYFNQKKYESAAKHFKPYSETKEINLKQKNDAYLRLGDSYFASSDYWKAMDEYNNAIEQKNVDSDYAYYQKAISYGFVGRNDTKIKELTDFMKRYPKSMYRDDAYYELGNTYTSEDNPTKAIESFDKVVNDFPNSHHVSRALLKQGLIYYNNDQNDEALSKFKKVATDFPKSEQAYEAITSARNIYVDIGKTDEYAEWVNSLGYAEVSDSEIDNATYESAENQFLEENNKEAIAGFKKYLDKFPEGAHVLPANYHLAQLLYKDEKYEEAKPYYEAVTDQPKNEYSEKSLERLARVYLEEDNREKTIPILERLEEESASQKNITFAQSNLMKAYYDKDDYAKTVEYAEKVLENDDAEDRAKSDAHIFVARSAIKTGDEEKAKEAYQEVAKMAGGKLAAEAQYYDAYFKRAEKEYEASNESVQVLAKDYSGYKEFSVKGLLLMGKNFYDLEDAYQATYILQNVIDNFDDYPEAVEKAEKELKRMKAEEAKTNSSVDSEEEAEESQEALDEIENE